MYCTRCGHRNPDEAGFCGACGEAQQRPEEQTLAISLDAVQEEAPPSLDELGPGQALLVIRTGPTAGSTVLLDKDVTRAGRAPECDVFLNDITVSRQHAEFLREGDTFTLKDAGSLNGTYVNRERVDVAQLASGDELQIGKFKLVFFGA
ncbi:MAG: FHA domain-containing protein [Actinomycetota bacterium]